MNSKVINISRGCKLAPFPRRNVTVRVLNVARRPIENASPKKSKAVVTDVAPCSVDRNTAHVFNQCWINFDKLDESKAQSCLVAADAILNENCAAEICDEEMCSSLDHADWFRRYVSNAFGLGA
eukprot:g7194.t1